MKLKPPFIITSTLSPGIKIGDSVLHLLDASEVTLRPTAPQRGSGQA